MPVDQLKDLIKVNINANMKDGDYSLVDYLIEDTHVLDKQSYY